MSDATATPAAIPPATALLGIGGAAGQILPLLAGQSTAPLSVSLLDTDQQTLRGAFGGQKILLGRRFTRGLGTGGDAQLARLAITEDEDLVRPLCAGKNLVVLVAGLGGGLGSGAAPVVARLCKEAGALVVAFAIHPFDCEGNRRRLQAAAALDELKSEADAVICFRNQKTLQLIDEDASILETFRFSNQLLVGGIEGLVRLTQARGLIPVDFADLCETVRGTHAESTFAVAEASGSNRVRSLLVQLWDNPMLGHGQDLAEADALLVSLMGGPTLTMAEASRVMSELGGRTGAAKVVMGAAVDEALGDRLAMMLVASRETPQASGSARNQTGLAGHDPLGLHHGSEPGTQFLSAGHSERPASRFVPPPPVLTPERQEELLNEQRHVPNPRRRTMARLQQGQLPLEIASKGRFEKSEPTIHQGEDLDMPTYIRRGIALN